MITVAGLGLLAAFAWTQALPQLEGYFPELGGLPVNHQTSALPPAPQAGKNPGIEKSMPH
jgi:hypothetical protein